MRRRVHVQSRAANLSGGEMGKSRREFLGAASAGLIAALTAADALPGGGGDAAGEGPAPGRGGGAACVWCGTCGWAGGFNDDVQRSGEAGADFAELAGADGGGGKLARDDGGAL